MTTTYPTTTWREGLARAGGLMAVVGLIAWAWAGTEFDLAKLADGLPRMCITLAR